MVNVRIELDENAVKDLVMQHLRDKLGAIEIKEGDVRIEVKSKQNYKSEWEKASYRAVYEACEFDMP